MMQCMTYALKQISSTHSSRCSLPHQKTHPDLTILAYKTTTETRLFVGSWYNDQFDFHNKGECE